MIINRAITQPDTLDIYDNDHWAYPLVVPQGVLQGILLLNTNGGTRPYPYLLRALCPMVRLCRHRAQFPKKHLNFVNYFTTLEKSLKSNSLSFSHKHPSIILWHIRHNDPELYHTYCNIVFLGFRFLVRQGGGEIYHPNNGNDCKSVYRRTSSPCNMPSPEKECRQEFKQIQGFHCV